MAAELQRRRAEREKAAQFNVSSLFWAFQLFSRIPGGLQLCLMATARCKGDWEMKLKVLSTSIVKIVREKTWLAR